MNIIGQIGILCAVCLAGEGIAALLPVPFPASVISLILLSVLLFTGVIRPAWIQDVSLFLLSNMAVVFVPVCVGFIKQFDAIRPHLLPIVAICVLTTPLVYAVTAWTAQALMRLADRRGEKEADGRD